MVWKPFSELRFNLNALLVKIFHPAEEWVAAVGNYPGQKAMEILDMSADSGTIALLHKDLKGKIESNTQKSLH